MIAGIGNLSATIVMAACRVSSPMHHRDCGMQCVQPIAGVICCVLVPAHVPGQVYAVFAIALANRRAEDSDRAE
jgi:hypothetical protein